MNLSNSVLAVNVFTSPLQVVSTPAQKMEYGTDELAVSKSYPGLVGWILNLEAITGTSTKVMPDGSERELLDTKELRVTMWLPPTVDLSTKITAGTYIQLDPAKTGIGAVNGNLYVQSLGFLQNQEAK